MTMPETIWAFSPSIFENADMWQNKPCPNGTTTGYVRADLAHHRVRVKPLEWYECEPGVFHALGANLIYRVLRRSTGEGNLRIEGAPRGLDYPTVEAAKAAAHADYERRILDALEASE